MPGTTAPQLEHLRQSGVQHCWNLGYDLPRHFSFEPPLNLQWAALHGDVAVGAFSYLVSGFLNDVMIGRYCSIGAAAQLGREEHPLNWLSTSPFQYLDEYHELIFAQLGPQHAAERAQILPFARFGDALGTARIRIGNDVWFGHGVFVRQGVTIGDGAAIGAHCVVTQDVPPYAVVGGSPAHVIRLRFPEPLIERLLQVQWWRHAFWRLRDLPWNEVERSLDLIEERRAAGLLPDHEATPVTERDAAFAAAG